MFLFLFSTLLGCSDIFIPAIVSMILNVMSKETTIEKQMRTDIIELKKQLQTVNMVDQFPAYAKLQRKINTLSIQYKEKINERKTGIQKVKFLFSILLRVLLGLCCLWLVWKYSAFPVASLPQDLIWPLGSILSLPYCQPGDISIVVWLPMVRTACGRFLKIVQHKV